MGRQKLNIQSKQQFSHLTETERNALLIYKLKYVIDDGVLYKAIKITEDTKCYFKFKNL